MERWKKVDGCDGYQVSSFGRVWTSKGRGEGKLLTQWINAQGYPSVGLWVNGRVKTCNIHKLVAGAFLPPDPSRPWVNHINHNKEQNHWKNLERCTPAENQRRINDRKSGRSSLGWLDVIVMRLIAGEKLASRKNISDAWGQSQSSISKILRKDSWIDEDQAGR